MGEGCLIGIGIWDRCFVCGYLDGVSTGVYLNECTEYKDERNT